MGRDARSLVRILPSPPPCHVMSGTATDVAGAGHGAVLRSACRARRTTADVFMPQQVQSVLFSTYSGCHAYLSATI